MRANTFAGQVIAVLSRRTSAFESDPAEPQTFPGRLRALFSRRRHTDTASPTLADTGQVTVIEKPGTEIPETAEPSIEAKEVFDFEALRLWAREIKLASPHIRLRMRAYPNFVDLENFLNRNKLDLDLDLVGDPTLVGDLARALVSDLDRDLDLDLDLTLALVGDLTLALVGDRALDLVRALALVRVHAIGCVLDLACDLEARLTSLLGVITDLDDALHDFTAADLRDIDLPRIHLEGLRWSSATQWPAGWVDQVARDSVEVEPGVFEVRSGGVYAPTWCGQPVGS